MAPPPADGTFSRAQSTAVNELLADKISRRTILGLRYDASFSADVIRLLNDLEVDILGQLVQADVTGVKMARARQARLEKLLTEVRASIKAQYKRIDRLTQGELFKFGQLEAAATGKALTDSAASVGVVLGHGLPTEATMAALLSDPLVMGAPLSDWWLKQSTDLFRSFAADVRIGTMAGETVDQMAKRVAGSRWGNLRGVRDIEVRGTILKARRGARTLVRTSVASVQGAARQATYQANSDVIEFYVHVSRLDSRTSDICLARAGKRWDAETLKPVGHSLPFEVPPLHPNCRSAIAPIPYGGGQLAKNLGADEWIQTLSVADQEALLGVHKSKLFRDGKITASALIDQSNRPLTLDELSAH